MNNIKMIREEKGISQRKLSAQAGVSQPYLHDLEADKRGARPETLERIAAALGVSVNALTGNENAGKPA